MYEARLALKRRMKVFGRLLTEASVDLNPNENHKRGK
jgi:hypothetical protein